MLLPLEAVAAARDELRRRLALPSRGAADERRTRLESRLSRLKAQFEWGDIEEREYQAKMADTRSELALLPACDKIVSFDDAAARVASLAAAIEVASPERLRELIRMLVVRVTTADRAVASIQIVPAMQPFFGPEPASLGAPPDGLQPPRNKASDPLDWYAAAAAL
jgi:hypothetical protein